MVCRICGKELNAHSNKEKDQCANEALKRMPPEQARLFRREWEILEKGLKRDTRSIYCLVAMIGSFITFMLLDILTIPSAMQAFSISLKTQNTDYFWKNFHVYSFDPYYISWLLPIAVLIVSWLCYRRINPSEKDIMKRIVTGDVP